MIRFKKQRKQRQRTKHKREGRGRTANNHVPDSSMMADEGSTKTASDVTLSWTAVANNRTTSGIHVLEIGKKTAINRDLAKR